VAPETLKSLRALVNYHQNTGARYGLLGPNRFDADACRILLLIRPASRVDAIPGEKTFGVSVIHVQVHVKHCERQQGD
jgi:hypothetical protein